MIQLESVPIILNLFVFSKSDGEKAMLEASTELRIVRGELENLMAIIDTKVCYVILYNMWPAHMSAINARAC